MKLVLDDDAFDELQLRVLTEIVTSVRAGLVNAGVSNADTLRAATEKISFAVAAIVDGSRVMKLKGKAVLPCLGFAESRDYEQVLHAEAGSWLHEYVFGTVDQVFATRDQSGA